MNSIRFTPEEFSKAAKHFIKLSDKYLDSWTLHQNDNEILTTYIKKEEFVSHRDKNDKVFMYRAEYVIFFNLNYAVPCFSFNMWDSSGKLLTLEQVRQILSTRITKERFYSVVTQQEHPVLYRPYFIVHPCHTANLLAGFKCKSKNLILTFLGMITPLIDLKLPVGPGVQ